jgi:hypothetical protein
MCGCQKFTVSLDRPDHARYYILTTEQADCFGLQARPSAGGKFAQQLSVEASVYSQSLGDGENDLSVRDLRADLVGHMVTR